MKRHIGTHPSTPETHALTTGWRCGQNHSDPILLPWELARLILLASAYLKTRFSDSNRTELYFRFSITASFSSWWGKATLSAELGARPSSRVIESQNQALRLLARTSSIEVTLLDTAPIPSAREQIELLDQIMLRSYGEKDVVQRKSRRPESDFACTSSVSAMDRHRP